MKNKSLLFCGIMLFCIIVAVIFWKFYTNGIRKNDYNFSDDYIAVFHGGYGEVVYETYIYDNNDGHNNYGFDYINVTKKTSSWGSNKWNMKITKRGTVEWTDNVFEVARDNGAYSYVTVPNSDKTYTIEQFKSMFIMN